MRRFGTLLVAALAVALADGAGTAGAQEPPVVKATRKKLQEKITIDLKEIGTKDFLEEIKREMDKPVSFKIDNTTGVSNNSKLTLKAKDQTVEKILNDLSDKYDFGWYVYSNSKDANDRYNGWVVIRKAPKKERGYEAGKEPGKEGAMLTPRGREAAPWSPPPAVQPPPGRPVDRRLLPARERRYYC